MKKTEYKCSLCACILTKDESTQLFSCLCCAEHMSLFPDVRDRKYYLKRTRDKDNYEVDVLMEVQNK